MTPEEARALLEQFLRTPDEEKDRQAAAEVWRRVQTAIVKGPRSKELSELHALAIAGDEAARERGDAILTTMWQEEEIVLKAEGEEG